MNIVGAVSRAGEEHSVLFCEYTGAANENLLIDDFLTGVKVSLDRNNIYCIAVRSENRKPNSVVGIYFHKDGVGCMVYELPYDYLTDYVNDIFSEELENVLGRKGGQSQ